MGWGGVRYDHPIIEGRKCLADWETTKWKSNKYAGHGTHRSFIFQKRIFQNQQFPKNIMGLYIPTFHRGHCVVLRTNEL